jgi:hypothetical protein
MTAAPFIDNGERPDDRKSCRRPGKTPLTPTDYTLFLIDYWSRMAFRIMPLSTIINNTLEELHASPPVC